MNRLFVKSLIGTAVVVTAIAGAWAYKREGDCQRLLSSTAALGDVEVRRSSAGVCYPCRLDGRLYDIMYRYCGTDDRTYAET
ncbi:MAG: hypothetical protein ACK4MH_05240 [Brevundimonas sp.]|uniref:hypothetical protein n=1 Tax=Brevundimonas sp. TaxID=1871086 RepID=UPI00391BEA17